MLEEHEECVYCGVDIREEGEDHECDIEDLKSSIEVLLKGEKRC